MKTFDEIHALATAPLHREFAETFTDHRLSWGVGVTQGVTVAMQEAQAEIDALKQQNAELLAAQQWRDIESAPPDEVLFLHNKAMGLSGVGYLNSYLDFWSWSYSSAPTHWQPLPPPPEAIAKARGESV